MPIFSEHDRPKKITHKKVRRLLKKVKMKELYFYFEKDLTTGQDIL